MKNKVIFKFLAASGILASSGLCAATTTHSQVVVNTQDSVAFARLTDQLDKLINAVGSIKGNPAKTANDRTRLVQTIIKKDQYADELSKTLTNYFLQQRIGTNESGLDSKLQSVHRQLVLLNEIKDSADLETVNMLGMEMTNFKRLFMPTASRNTYTPRNTTTTSNQPPVRYRETIQRTAATETTETTTQQTADTRDFVPALDADDEVALPATTAKKAKKVARKGRRRSRSKVANNSRTSNVQKRANHQAKRLQRLAESRRRARMDALEKKKQDSFSERETNVTPPTSKRRLSRNSDFNIPNKEDAQRRIAERLQENPPPARSMNPEFANLGQKKAPKRRSVPPELAKAEREKVNLKPATTAEKGTKKESILARIKNKIFTRKKEEQPVAQEDVDFTQVRYRKRSVSVGSNTGKAVSEASEVTDNS